MDWRKRQSLEHDHPTVAGGERRQLLEGQRHEAGAKVIRWARTSLGWLSSNLECRHDATHINCSTQVINPILHFRCLSTLQRSTQQLTLFGQRCVLHQARVIRPRNHCPQVTQIDSFNNFFYGIHAVVPFSNSQSRQQFDNQIDQAVGVDFRLAVFCQQRVLFVNRLAHGPNTAGQCLFSQDAFLWLKGFEHGFAMNVQWVQTCCSWALGQFGWGRRELTTRCTWGTGSTGVSWSAIVAALIGALVASFITALVAPFFTALIAAL